MRFMLVICIWAVFVGGLFLFMSTRHLQDAPTEAFSFSHLEDEYSMAIAITFEAQPDPYSQMSESGDKPESLFVKLNGVTIYRTTETLAAGSKILFPITGLTKGKNEFFVAINPPTEKAHLNMAALVKILCNGNELVAKSFWAEDGVRIAGTLTFDEADFKKVVAGE